LFLPSRDIASKKNFIMKILFFAVAVFTASIYHANAQAAYAGSYWVVCSWGTGDLAGLGSGGPATATRSGRVTITQFFGDNSSGSFSANINRTGRFRLTSPNFGSAQIYSAGKRRFAGNTWGVGENGYSSGGTWTFSNVYLP
jgi:hypothetical protein